MGSSGQVKLAACPNPWCEAEERAGDYSPVVRLHHHGNYRVVCTSCVFEGPLRSTKDEAIAAWNTRHDSIAELVEAFRPFVDMKAQNGAWGVINKKLDGMAPMTVTVTKAQMLAAFNALNKARSS